MYLDPPYGVGEPGVDEHVDYLVEQYLYTKEYDHVRGALRQCTPQFREAFLRIAAYQPSLQSDTERRRFIAFVRHTTLVPDFYKAYCYYVRQAREAGAFRLSPTVVFMRTTWDFVAVDPDESKIAINNMAIRSYADMYTLEHPQHPNIFRNRRPKALRRHRLVTFDCGGDVIDMKTE